MSFKNECKLQLNWGGTLRCPNSDENSEGCDYVRICDSEGKEVAYWDFEEWQREPKLVMGAIFGTAISG